MTGPRRVQILWTAQAGQAAQLITLDCSVSEKHSFNTTVTDHPVEKGLNISDHLRPEPITLELEGRVSNQPIFLIKDNSDGSQETQVAVSGAQPTVGSVIGSPIPIVGAFTRNIPLPFAAPQGIVKGFDPQFNRVKNVLDQFLVIRAKGYLISVITTLKSYDNMAITSFDVPRNAQYSDALHFTMQCKEIRFGATQTEPAPKIPTKKADKGTTVTTPADADALADHSLLQGIFGSH